MTKNNTESSTPIGGYIFSKEPITFNTDRKETLLTVRNTGDRPIQIGSHFHFFEVNKALEFDRAAAFGKRLNITATTAIRFEPGDEVKVSLIPIGGKQVIHGFNNLVENWVGESSGSTGKRAEESLAIKQAIELGYKNTNNK